MFKDLLTGNTTEHLTSLNNKDNSPLIHKEMREYFLLLQKECKNHNIDLKIVSSFRSFERQLLIWNNKASGKRPLLDSNENVLDFSELSELEVVHSILRWSALPGCSRHHWGTDIDVIDETARPSNYEVQLVPSEYQKGGIFEKLNCLLNDLISANKSFGFYRPYSTERNGVSPEMWHISYSPLSNEFKEQFTFEFFKDFLDKQNEIDFFLLKVVKDNAKEIYDRYIINTD